MIGPQPTGLIDGVQITAVAHEGLTVLVDGRPGRLAVLDEAGNVVAQGDDVASEALNVSVNCYRAVLQNTGHLRVLSLPLKRVARAAAPANDAAISAGATL